MQIDAIEIPFRSRLTVKRFYFFSDIHLGAAQCDESKLRCEIEMARRDVDAMCFILGDVSDYISPQDWRFRSNNIASWVDQDDLGQSQVKRAIELFSPIAKKLIGVLQGNHEDAIQRDFNNNVHKHLVDGLGVRDLGYSSFLRLQFAYRRIARGRKKGGGDFRKLDLLLHHGFGGGRTEGADMNKFNEFALSYDADLIVSGHTHKRGCYKDKVYFLNQHNALDVRYRLKCRAGTYLNTIVENGANHTYAERAGMRPVSTGALIVTYRPYDGELIANV